MSMNSSQLRQLRNQLEADLCVVSKDSKEYENLSKRKAIVTDKVFNKILEENKK